MTVPPAIRERVRGVVLDSITEGLRRERPGHDLAVVEPNDAVVEGPAPAPKRKRKPVRRKHAKRMR